MHMRWYLCDVAVTYAVGIVSGSDKVQTETHAKEEDFANPNSDGCLHKQTNMTMDTANKGKSTDASSKGNVNTPETTSTPTTTVRDQACAFLARAALFPNRVDWSGKQHRRIQPAVQQLDQLRHSILEQEDETISFSKLFPRHVLVVPAPNGDGMQWTGQPDLKDSTVEVIPQHLVVRAQTCSDSSTRTSFTRSILDSTKQQQPKQIMREIVLCSNRLLQSDYDKSTDPTLVKARTDVPPRSLAAVEQGLARELYKIRKYYQKDNDSTKSSSSSSKPAVPSSCPDFARLEYEATLVAECLYQKEESESKTNNSRSSSSSSKAEVYRGRFLQPPGFSLLSTSLQGRLRHQCAAKVARETTAQVYGPKVASKCVQEAKLSK